MPDIKRPDGLEHQAPYSSLARYTLDLEERIAGLIAAVENAPHGSHCKKDSLGIPALDCWKCHALATYKGDES